MPVNWRIVNIRANPQAAMSEVLAELKSTTDPEVVKECSDRLTLVSEVIADLRFERLSLPLQQQIQQLQLSANTEGRDLGLQGGAKPVPPQQQNDVGNVGEPQQNQQAQQ